MRGMNNLQKNIFLALLKIAQKFHYFCKGSRLSNFRRKFNFTKTALNSGETLLLMKGTNNLQKNIFLAQFKIAQNFYYFC